MSFAAAWAFGGLVVLVPLVLLHLRRRGRVVREVPSLVLWEELQLLDAKDSRGFRWPSLPLLLLLQALAVVLLVAALAEPTSAGTRRAKMQVIVIDDSWRMQAPGRIAEARSAAARILAADPAGTRVGIVLANGLPGALFQATPGAARRVLARLKASAGPADFATALSVADGLLSGSRDQLALIRAPEDGVPLIAAGSRQVRTLTLAASSGDQGIFDATARCAIGATQQCEVDATVRNTGARTVVERITATASGHSPLALAVTVRADSQEPLTLLSAPGQQVSLRLRGGDSLSADDTAWVSVPAVDELPESSLVTLVGSPTVALASARAFAAVPGVTLRLRTAATLRPKDLRESALVVLDHSIPRAGLPPTPAVLLIDPPRIPGGKVGGALSATVVSGTDAGSELLDGVDLSSLSIDSGSARKLVLPRWLAPVVWSPDGVLLAAGANGRQRVATLSFEPGQSDLPQLPALPILAANLVQWAARWAPTNATAGMPFAVEASRGVRSVALKRGATQLERVPATAGPVVLHGESPGLYRVRESGPGIAREATVAVNTAEAAPAGAQGLELPGAPGAGESRPSTGQMAWFLIGALVLLALEWAYSISHRRVVVA